MQTCLHFTHNRERTSVSFVFINFRMQTSALGVQTFWLKINEGYLTILTPKYRRGRFARVEWSPSAWALARGGGQGKAIAPPGFSHIHS